MKSRPAVRGHTLFVRIIVMFLLILLPLMLTGIVIHEWGLRIIREKLAESIRTQTSHTAETLEREFERIRLLQNDLLIDDDLLFLSSVPDAFGDFERVKAVNRLKSRAETFVNSNVFVEDVRILIRGIDRSISAVDGIEPLTDADRSAMLDFPAMIASRLTSEDGRLGTTIKGELRPAGTMPPFVIRMRLSPKAVVRAVDAMNLYQGSVSWLYCADNGFLASAGGETPGMSGAEEPDATNPLPGGMQAANIETASGERDSSAEAASGERNSSAVTASGEADSSVESASTYTSTPLWLAVRPLLETAEASGLDSVQTVLAVGGVRRQVSAQRFVFGKPFWLVATAPEAQLLQSLVPYRLMVWGFVAVSLLLVTIFALSLRRSVHRPMTELVEAFRRVESGDFGHAIDHDAQDEFGYLYGQFNNMLQYIHHLVHEVYSQTILNQKAELKQLQSQINPHFLYNSFFILQRMIQGGDTDSARAFSGWLGRYFQYVTRNAQDTATLEQEVRHTANYLEIQAVRFAGTEIEIAPIPEEIRNVSVPRLILQPLVENIFNHAFRKEAARGCIAMRFESTDGLARVIVENSGSGVDSDEMQAIRDRLEPGRAGEVETTGLVNIHRRLRLTYGERAGLSLSESPLGGWLVALTVPVPAAVSARMPSPLPGVQTPDAAQAVPERGAPEAAQAVPERAAQEPGKEA